MTDITVNIPDRELFKAAEVCEIASVQPYVLRSWESEFPRLGMTRGAGAPRVYRRSDIEMVLRIKQLVFSEGLTLSGARRKLDDELPGVPDDPAASAAADTRKRVAGIRKDLKSILEILNKDAHRAAPALRPAAAGQPTLLDLSADQQDNEQAAVALPPAKAAKQNDARKRRKP